MKVFNLYAIYVRTYINICIFCANKLHKCYSRSEMLFFVGFTDHSHAYERIHEFIYCKLHSVSLVSGIDILQAQTLTLNSDAQWRRTNSWLGSSSDSLSRLWLFLSSSPCWPDTKQSSLLFFFLKTVLRFQTYGSSMTCQIPIFHNRVSVSLNIACDAPSSCPAVQLSHAKHSSPLSPGDWHLHL